MRGGWRRTSSGRRSGPATCSASCSWAGSPGTPTASSAATTTSARSGPPPTSAAGSRSAATTATSRTSTASAGATSGPSSAPGTEVLMFAMTSGTTDRPKTIPVTRESLADYREGWTIWGILAFDAHPGMLQGGLRPILQLASDWREHFTPVGHPLRRDHRPDGPDAEPARPVHLLHAPGRLADQGHRVEILRGPAALGPPGPGDDHRRQPEHDPGHRPAGRPREGHPHPRPGRRHHRPEVDHPAGRPPGDPDQDPLEAQGGGAPARGDRRADRPAPPQGLLAQPRVPRQLDGRDDGGLSPRLSRILRRPPGPRHRPDRLRGADDDPDRGRHARRASSTSATITSSSCPRTRSAATSPRRSRPPT